ncbi:MAG: hypothetical protein HRU26_02150 [Psychroserpens sp.]|nr:hypothetical protein [Psychroserpens sp.]
MVTTVLAGPLKGVSVFEAVEQIPPNYHIDYPRDEDQLFKTLNAELDNKDSAIEKAKELMK